ncbi:hypothetical protein [Nostoc sp.]|uniref:hypothetical protein n=1 Tax=Nostoc sp. TaxID=1180 RepID=UPI002FF60300
MLKKNHCLSMHISDLSYLESVSEDEFILGSFGVSVISEALSLSSNNSPFASANSTSTSFSSDVYRRSYGTGLAVASGDYSTASITLGGDGDIVIGKTRYNFSENTAVASGSVIAIDLLDNLDFL